MGQPHLRWEREILDRRLYDRIPSIPTGRPLPTPPGDLGLGQCSIRMLLTWLSYWRGAGANLFSPGVWPRLTEYEDRVMFELGPVLDARHPLLTNDQCIRLLCEGSLFNRAGEYRCRDALEEIELDLHNSPARMRTILPASIFHEWRDGTYVWRQTLGFALTPAELPGLNCRLAHTRASMARIIAGLSVDMLQLTYGDTPRAFSYPDEYHPSGGFGALESEPSDGSSYGDESPARAGPGPRTPPDGGLADGYAFAADPGATGG
jgi:hypothetical protein